MGNQFLLNIKLIDVETSETVRSSSQSYKTIDDLVNDSRSLTYRLLNKPLAGKKQTAESEEEPEEKSVRPEPPKEVPSPAVKLKRNLIFLNALYELVDEDLYILLNYTWRASRLLGLPLRMGYGIINLEDFTIQAGFGFSDALRRELKSRGIPVQVACPMVVFWPLCFAILRD